jgi:hypothetical protein
MRSFFSESNDINTEWEIELASAIGNAAKLM